MIALEEHQHAIMAYLHQQYEEKKGLLSFADFMNIALYAPGLGYYSAGKIKIGQQGDFVTAPEISPLFFRSAWRINVNNSFILFLTPPFLSWEPERVRWQRKLFCL